MTLRIGNFSGFYGDRLDALHEMLTGGELDVLTGDFLAELTMLILGRDRIEDPAAGFARTFLRQLEDCLGLAHERGVRIVTNAGGLNPAGLADAVRELADRLGVPARVAHVEGDDLRGRFPDALAAHAYLGGFGIAACLREGADIVVTGRVTDAALVTGPAAAHFGWAPDDHDRLAGAVVAGHVLECGTQATGGNYAFFREADVRRPGFPVAELHADGSCVITKHPGTGGLVDVGTVTAQLLYETGGARYAGPDVTARLDSVRLESDGPDRVRIVGVRGEPPPPDLKVGLSRIGGFRNEVAFVLTGLDIEAKAALVREQMETYAFAESRPAEVRWDLVRGDRADAGTEEGASAVLRLVVRDVREETVGRALSGAAVELALGSYPGFHVLAPPGRGSPYGVFEAAYVPQSEVEHRAVLDDGRRIVIPPAADTLVLEPVPAPDLPPPPAPGPVLRVPLGTIAGARSGDKGGDANVGVWVRSDEAWRWLAHELTVDRFRELIPESRALTVTRHLLPGLRALNFVVEGILGAGVAAHHRFDPQAKALGEWLRARHVDVPEALLPTRSRAMPTAVAAPDDAVVHLLPSPADIPPITGHDLYSTETMTRKADEKEPFSALVFKIMTDPHVGKLTYIRAYSGLVATGTTLLNATTSKKERIGRLMQMHADKREEIEAVYAGDICAVIGLKDARTGDTLCDMKNPIVLERMHFPEPVLSVAIEPKTTADQEKLSEALVKLSDEDPTFQVRTDEETGQTLIAGMGELHLEILVDRMMREFRVAANVGRPQVAYKEAFGKAVDAEGKFIKQTGGRGQYGHVWIHAEPIVGGEDNFIFENKTIGGTVPREYVPAVEKGLKGALTSGVLAGYPVVGVKIQLTDGSYHEVDSSEIAFQMAASMAFKEAMRRSNPVLMEPIMDVEVVVPKDYMGDVIADLSSRRGKIAGMTQRAEAQVITARVPLAEMFGYATALRSLTQGRAVYTMQFACYEPAPKSVAEEVINKFQGKVAG